MFDWFHDYCLSFLLFILTFVLVLLTFIASEQVGAKVIPDLQILEFIWTLLPSFILLAIGLPRIIILYSYDIESRVGLTVKVVGHQWYWSYTLADFEEVEFDRYIKSEEDLRLGDFRILETDNHLVIPFTVPVRFVVNRADVIHSWAIPRIALKVDANPGFLNILNRSFSFPGLYFGQCSEICGANHRFIPICIEVSSLSIFKNWVIMFYYE